MNPRERFIQKLQITLNESRFAKESKKLAQDVPTKIITQEDQEKFNRYKKFLTNSSFEQTEYKIWASLLETISPKKLSTESKSPKQKMFQPFELTTKQLLKKVEDAYRMSCKLYKDNYDKGQYSLIEQMGNGAIGSAGGFISLIPKDHIQKGVVIKSGIDQFIDNGLPYNSQFLHHKLHDILLELRTVVEKEAALVATQIFELTSLTRR